MSQAEWPPTTALLAAAAKGKDGRYARRQHYAALLANLPSLVAGLALGWSAPALPLLLAESPEEARGESSQGSAGGLSLAQGAWLGALLPLASLAGALSAGPLAERAGRKGALLAAAAPALLGWPLMAFAPHSFWMLLVGRVLTGAMTGAVSAPAALYCEEIAEARARGALGSYQFMGNCVGVLIMYAMGAWLPYSWFTAAPVLPCLLFVLTFCWMPESPAFLAARGRRAAADAALRWLRGPFVDVDAALRELIGSGAATVPAPAARPAPAAAAFASLAWSRPWRSTTLRGFSIAALMMVFQQTSGIILFVFYIVQVIDEVGNNFSSYTSSIILGAINVVAVFVSSLVVDRAGRKLLLLISTCGMGLCLTASAMYSLKKEQGWDPGPWKWIPLSSIAVHGICFTLGMGPVSWIMLAELLPMESKGWASPAVVCVNRIGMFLVAKEAPFMLVYAGQVTTFLCFGSLCFVGAAFIAFCVPETKGKTKPEILKAIGGDLP